MKLAIITLASFLVAFACFTLPSTKQQIGALPDNLWTSRGQWSLPTSTSKVLTWKRTEYGFPWAWLVRDESISEPAWYARMDTIYLYIYGLFSAALAFMVFVISKTFKRAEQGAAANP